MDPIERELRDRPDILDAYRFASRRISPHLSPEEAAAWRAGILQLYRVNAGPRLLRALWMLQARILPQTPGSCLPALMDAVRILCRESGARAAGDLIEAITGKLVFCEDGRKWQALLAGLAAVCVRAPEATGAIASSLSPLLDRLDASDIPGWAEDAVRLYPGDRRSRLRYFALDDPAARHRLAVHEGAVRFDAHRKRLSYLARALFARDLMVQPVVTETRRASARTRLAGPVILMPDLAPPMSRDRSPAYFEAAAVHALCHQRFTTRRFSPGRMKPLQMALVSLLEDARVERLAIRDFPGLSSLFLPFHTTAATNARSTGSLMARLARALADSSFNDDDQWIGKGRALFEAAFAETPEDQSFCETIARVLGHDLGQMRIPFDAKSYIVEPIYRDDGVGLFDMDEREENEPDPQEIVLEGARIEQADDAEDEPGTETGSARHQPADQEDDRGPVLGVYREWDYRLHSDALAEASVRAATVPTIAAPNWLDRAMGERRREAERIAALVRRARMGRPQRGRRRMEGDDIDLDMLVETMIARASGQTPDPRIYSVKRRIERDVALTVLIDSSQSTEAAVAPGGATILETAALATGLFAEALDRLGDRFAVYSFSSDGPENVRLATIKDFQEGFGPVTERLAGLTPGLSTRMGAALRHVSVGLASQSAFRKVLLVITDGEPSDRDVTDPDYLIEDARHAVAQGRDRGLDLFCIALGEHADRSASRIFGRRNTSLVQRVSDLPARLSELYFRLTVS